MGLDLPRHPHPGVTDSQHDKLSGRKRTITIPVASVEGDVRCLKAEPTAVRHGIPSIGDKIDDHLFDLARIDPHSPKTRFSFDNQPHVLPHETT